MQFFGHPCDRPKDIRARSFILSWITEDRKVPLKYKDQPRPIFRVEYQCLGGCNIEAPELDKYTSEEDHNEDTDDDSNNDDDKRSKKEARGVDQEIKAKGIEKEGARGGSGCPRKVKIHVRNS